MYWWDTVKKEEGRYYRGVPGSWNIPYDTPVETWEPITQAEYDEILESYLLEPVELRVAVSGEERREVQQAFTAILEDGGMFYADRQNGEEMSLERYCETFTDGLAAVLTEFTLVDFEQDGIPEAVFRIALGENTDCGVLVLHWEDSKVWGYTFSNREMQEIKADGTVWWSGSSSNYGAAKISFSRGEYAYQNIAWAEEADGGVKYYLEGAEISYEAFKHHSTLLGAKEDTRWVCYPNGDYAKLLERF